MAVTHFARSMVFPSRIVGEPPSAGNTRGVVKEEASASNLRAMAAMPATAAGSLFSILKTFWKPGWGTRWAPMKFAPRWKAALALIRACFA